MLDYGLGDDTPPAMPMVTVESFYRLTMTLGLDATLSEAGGQTTITPDTFYVESGAELEVGARVHETDLDDFNLRFGFLDLVSRNGTFEMEAVVTTDFTDADGKIEASELDASTAISADGSVRIDLPVEVAPISGFSAFSDTFNFETGLPSGTPVERAIILESTAIFTDPTFGVVDGPDHRTALSLQFENFDELEPFRDVGGLHLISVLQQIESVFDVLETLQPRDDGSGNTSEPLFGADLPFIDDTAISDMLAFGESLGAKIAGLLQPLGNSFTPTFDSVQEFASELTGVLGTSILDDVLPSYDFTSHELTFNVAFSAEFEAPLAAADFDFNLALGPIANLSVSGDFGFQTLLELAFTAGIDLDESGDISIVTAFAPFGIISLAPASDGVIANNARFRLDYGFGRADVEVLASDTTGFTLNQLADHLNTEIDAAIAAAIAAETPAGETPPPGPQVNVVAVGGRLQIVTLDTAFLQITKLTAAGGDEGGFAELGFRDGQIASDGWMPEDGVLSGPASFSLNYNGTSHTVTVNPDAGNDTIADLVANIQAAVNTAFTPGLITVEYQPTAQIAGTPAIDIGGVIVFKPTNVSPTLVDFISIDGVNAVAANELGLRNDSVSSDIQLTGEHETTIPAMTPGNVLATDASFQLDLTALGVTKSFDITVFAASTTLNGSLQDLADDINSALAKHVLDDETTRLDRVISAVVEDGNIVLKSTSYRAFDSITVTDVSGSLGFGASTTIGPKLDGAVTDAEFVLELQQKDGSVLRAEFLGADAIDNSASSLGALVDTINTALLGTDLAGKVVAGLADGARIVFAVLPNGTMPSGDDPVVLRITQTNQNNQETRDHLGFQENLGARAGGTLDAFIEDVSLEATLNATATVVGTADFGFVGLDIEMGVAIEGTAAFEYAGRLDIGTLLGAGTSLERIELLVSDLLDGFSLDASATATATSIDIVGAAGGGLLQQLQDALGATPELTITFSNLLSHAAPAVSFDLGDIEDFADFDFSDVTLVLDKIAGFLGALTGIDFLDQPLPIVDIRLGDALDLVDEFLAAVQDIKNNPAGHIQELLDSLNEGLARFTNGDALLSFANGDLLFDLGFDTAFSAVLPLNIDLVDLLAGTGGDLPDGFLDLSGAANLQAEFSAIVNLGFGIDVDALAEVTDGPFDTALPALLGAIFLRTGDPGAGGTGINVTGFARASNVNFTAAVGPLGLYVTNGSAVLNAGGGLNDNTPAQFSLELPSGTQAGRLTLQEIIDPQDLFDNIEAGDLASLDLGVSAVLPISFPTASNFIGNAAFDLVVGDPFDTG
ncbi:MAG TPA: hypothetical protein VK630_00075, partial [Reyranella sp.]|nr:hypothetical protein [Reyranella sp.]